MSSPTRVAPNPTLLWHKWGEIQRLEDPWPLPSGDFSLMGVMCVNEEGLWWPDILAVNPHGKAEGAQQNKGLESGAPASGLVQAVWPWTHLLTSLSLYFPIWKMWIVIDPTSQGYGEI